MCNSGNVLTAAANLNIVNALVLLIRVIIHYSNRVTDHIGISVEHTLNSERSGLARSYDKCARQVRVGLALKTPELTAVHCTNGKAATTADNDQNGPRHDILAKRHALAKECAKDNVADKRTNGYRDNDASSLGNTCIAPKTAIQVKEPKNNDIDKREHSNCWTCAGSSTKCCPMLRSPRCNKHREKGRSKVIDHQRVRFEGAQLSLLLCALGFSVQNLLFSPLLIPLSTSPPPGILPVPLNSRLHLGDRLFKVSHCALLG